MAPAHTAHTAHPAHTADDAALIAECRAIMTRHSRSFDRAASFLPPATRDRVAVLYAFCRIVDDAVDEATDPDAARHAIEALHRELHAVTGEGPALELTPRPVVAAFARHLGGSREAVAAAHALCEGVASDVIPARFLDDHELLRYCYRVAGAVGVLMCPTLGVTDPRALPFAVDFGIAMQLTNICRDVLEDAQHGRVYLPAARLASAGTSQEALLEGRADRRAISRVVLDLLALADRYYASTDLGVSYIPLLGRQAILVARALYAAIGHKLRREGGDALKGRTMLAGRDKAVLIARALTRNLDPTTHALHAWRGHPAHDARLHRHLVGFPGVDPRA